MDILLSDEQQALFEIMEQTKQHLFITGRAGAGKSVLLRHFREETKKRVVIAAPTGIAALNVKGQTIHSLFKLAPELYRPGSLEPNSRLYTLLKRIETLVIDEISMVRADLLDAIDERFRKACDNDKPFGGKQVIMFGDCYQLPPVVDKDLMQYFEHVHNGYFFFNALVWKQAEFKIFELTQVFRQKDPVFKDILNAVRDGSVVGSQIDCLNARYGVPIPDDGKTITLAPTNSLVTNINQKRLEQLDGKVYEYKATLTGKMSKSTFPTEEVIQLKVGAQVVLLQNDKDKRWVNGTVATVAALEKYSREKKTEDKITVRVDGIDYVLEKATWEETKYEYDSEAGKVKAEVVSSFTQFPVRLAWALTIHKSQGQTYQSIALDLTTSTFAPGQMYVALSRATSMEGLYLKMPVKSKDILVDAKVVDFMAKRETIKVDYIESQIVQKQEETKAIAVVSDIHHDEIVLVDEVQEQTKAVTVLSDILPVETLHHDEIEAMKSSVIEEVAFQIKQDLGEQLQAERSDQAFAREILGEMVLSPVALPLDGETVIEGSLVVVEQVEDSLVEGRVSRIAAIEVLCPACGSPCMDKVWSPMITYDLVGHSVECSSCHKMCIVPLNAFSLQGNVVAREKPAGQATQREKKGRTKKERKSKAGRKAKSGAVREPTQLSLDVRTIATLTAMKVNRSALFEELLQQYEPFLLAWSELGYESYEGDDDSDE